MSDFKELCAKTLQRSLNILKLIIKRFIICKNLFLQLNYILNTHHLYMKGFISMKDGFIKVAAGSIETKVADVSANASEIKLRIDEADAQKVNLLVLPELCITGYTCGDLFYSDILLNGAKNALDEIREYTYDKYPVVVAGLPVKHLGKLYNCAAVIHNGNILALVPKTHLPNSGEAYEKRQFESGSDIYDCTVDICGDAVDFGANIIFKNSESDGFAFGVEIGEDLWAPCPPSTSLCLAGAAVIANPAACSEGIGKPEYRRTLAASVSARLNCGYVYSDAGAGESTQDVVFSQHCIICENGSILAENEPFGTNSITVSEIDVDRLISERHKNTAFTPILENISVIDFEQPVIETALTRKFEKNPFVPDNADEAKKRAELILKIQANGLKKRMEHTNAKTAVLGISGGLDSCLALLVSVRAFDLMKKSRKDIIAVTMPCFGTTSRTKSNAELLCNYLGVTLKTVNIAKSVTQHLEDIGHDINVHNVTYENAQARERTQVIMDIANDCSGLVIGTGDLSELALGWATYNGDHMSMYGVNASVPKTLVRHLVRYEADSSEKNLADVLYDILDTPVSPELLPAAKDGEISQKTEDLVGPYELHDFFLYYFVRLNFAPSKVYRLAKYAFTGEYSDDVILKWLKTFIRRFFNQQFKRSCLPDGPKVGTVSLSPRGDLKMPSDAVSNLWLNDLESM